MTSSRPKISVCIPAYNRASVLGELLDSILQQEYDDFEVVICEDNSPERQQISEVVSVYQSRYPEKIRYIENKKNLGYDGNLRNIIEQAHGQYCLFMGNDDLMCPGALGKVGSALERYDNVGVLVRSYEAFDGTPDNVVQTFRYFDSERFFPAGAESIATVFRRSVVIPGMVIHRDSAVRWATDKFDGVLLYQLYLVANILVEMNAVFLPDILVLYRNHGTPDFGNAEAERGKFVPTEHTPESSLHFMQGMFDIARYVEQERGVPIYRPILKDVGNYSWPILDIQRDKPISVFCSYWLGLARMGLWTSPMFFIYFLLLLFLGSRRVEKLVIFIKKRLGHTPTLGNIFRGHRG